MTTPVDLDSSTLPALERIVAILRRPVVEPEEWRAAFGDMSLVLLKVAAGPPPAPPPAPPAAPPAAGTIAEWSAFRTGESVSVLSADVVLSGSVRGGAVAAARASVRDGGTVSFAVDAATGNVTVLSGHGREATSVTWSPDGRTENGPTVENALANARMAPEVVAEGLAQLDRLPGGTAPESQESAAAPGAATPAAGPAAGRSAPPPVLAPPPSSAADVEVCGHCGEIMHAGERYCPRCGAGMGPVAGPVCAGCGATLPPDARFCPACGAAGGPVVTAPPSTPIVTTRPTTPPPYAAPPAATRRDAPPPIPPPTVAPGQGVPVNAPASSSGQWARRLRWILPLVTTVLVAGVAAFVATRPSTPGPSGSPTTPATTSPAPSGPTSVTTPTAVSPYLGLRYAALPAGVTQFGDGAPLGGYRVRWVRDASTSMFWLERILEEESGTSPGAYEVVDVVAVPAQQEGTADVFLVGGVPCEVDGVSTDAVAGVFGYRQPPAYYVQVSAWRIDTAGGRLVPLGPGVRCRDQVTGA